MLKRKSILLSQISPTRSALKVSLFLSRIPSRNQENRQCNTIRLKVMVWALFCFAFFSREEANARQAGTYLVSSFVRVLLNNSWKKKQKQQQQIYWRGRYYAEGWPMQLLPQPTSDVILNRSREVHHTKWCPRKRLRLDETTAVTVLGGDFLEKWFVASLTEKQRIKMV